MNTASNITAQSLQQKYSLTATTREQLSSVSIVKPLITISEARKILAEEASVMSDDDIEVLIQNMGELASYGLEMAQVR